MAEEGIELLAEHMRAPHYVDGDSHFVRTLLKAYEEYTGLKGSCQYTGGGTYVHLSLIHISSVGTDIMPAEKRGNIGQVKPTGWHTVKYDFVDGKYLYNRCHLIGYQLTAENANEKNLITGTRYLNCLLYTSRYHQYLR